MFFVSISILGVNIGGISDHVPLLIVDCQVHGLIVTFWETKRFLFRCGVVSVQVQLE